MRHILPITLFVSMVACGNANPKFQIINLPSGKSIKVICVEKHTYTDDTPVLFLKYQSDLLAENERLIDKEIDEVWESFRIETERANLVDAGIQVFTRPTGNWFASKTTSFTYSFKRLPNGQWSRLR